MNSISVSSASSFMIVSTYPKVLLRKGQSFGIVSSVAGCAGGFFSRCTSPTSAREPWASRSEQNRNPISVSRCASLREEWSEAQLEGRRFAF